LATDLPGIVVCSDDVARLQAELGDGELALRAFLAAVTAIVIARFLHQDDVTILLQSSTRHVLIRLAVTEGLTSTDVIDRVIDELKSDVDGRPAGNDAAHAAVVRTAPSDRSFEALTGDVKAECYVGITKAHTGRPVLELRYEASLDPALMEQLLDSIIEASRSIVEHRSSPLAIEDISLVSETRRAELLDRCRGATKDYRGEQTTRDLIEDAVKSAPDVPAVIFGEQSLTYQQLDGKANALATLLQGEGIGQNDVLGLLVGNSLELPIAILAALKLGAIFMPLDELWPTDRLTTIVKAAKPTAILALEDGQALDGIEVIRVDERSLASIPGFQCISVTPCDLAYGFPTSGSSGSPKCALNVHRGLLNRLLYMTGRYGGDGGRVTLQNSKHVFDSSLWQLLWPLTTGGCVVIPPAAQRLDLDETIALIEQHGVTMTDFVPSVFNVLVEHLERVPQDVGRLMSLENLLIGGEEISASYCRRFNALLPNVGLTNTYGPTEAAIGMVFHAVLAGDGDRIPLGRPIDNTFAIVLDERRRLIPPGAVGELFIGGDCLGVGYLNDPERTRGAWVDNVFPELPGEHLYRTGDLVYQQPDGLLYFVGREDTQVKIGGVRIELSEIEHTLRKFTGVKEVAVCVEDGITGKRLVAYVATDHDLSRSDIRAFLTQRLPKQYLPSRFVLLEALPLTHNGKVDRKQLSFSTAQLDAQSSQVTSCEARLLEMWRQMLDEPGEITRDDDFFELGGDSLLALHLLVEVEQAFDVKLTLKGFYSGPTVKQLSEVIDAGGPQKARQTSKDDLDRVASDLALVDGLVLGNVAVGNDPKFILVTGASGFMGLHIVSELLRRSSSVRVLCTMRDAVTSEAHKRLSTKLEQFGLWRDDFAERIEIVSGDLGVKRLGLPQSMWADLESDLEAVVHCGGIVDFLHDYEYHRRVNVLSTVDLLKLAMKGKRKAMYHLSSADVVKYEGDHIVDRPSQSAPASGYALSKWVAEQLVANARLRGADVTLFRIGEAMPHRRTGLPNVSSLVYLLLKTCLTLGEYPEGLVRLDYTPVDCIAQVVGDAILQDTYRGKSIGLFHPCGTTLDWVMNVFRSLGADVSPTTAEKFLRLLEGDVEENHEVYTVLCVLRAAREAQLEEGGRPESVLESLFGAPADSLGPPAYGATPDFWPRIDHEVLEPVLRHISAKDAQSSVGDTVVESSCRPLQMAVMGDDRRYR
jgi:amino acid adenylation domain-containing protein/thioester reductase-like protein